LAVSRGFFAVLVVLGLAAAGPITAVSTASSPQGGDVAKPSAAPAKPVKAAKTRAEPPKPVTLAPRIRIAGVRFGTLRPDRAERVVQKAFDAPLLVVVNKLRLRVAPAKLAKPYVAGAVGKARHAKPGTKLPLVVSVRGAAVRAWAKRLAARVDRVPARNGLGLRDGRPFIAPRAYGRRLDQADLVRRVVRALSSNSRRPVHATTAMLQPRALASAKSPVIVINRSANTLSLFHGTKPWRTFRVATGQYAYPTPRGRFDIVVKWRNPWWYPPNSAWAAGQSPVPPGPGNPLGTRWMGLSSPGVGIHGTPKPESIGYSASHGCIRMLIPQAEWLFEHVDVGTTVFIV
jgi:lipoprotein-anchoring transpeptidase ErfK/SrfK